MILFLKIAFFFFLFACFIDLMLQEPLKYNKNNRNNYKSLKVLLILIIYWIK